MRLRIIMIVSMIVAALLLGVWFLLLLWAGADVVNRLLTGGGRGVG